MPKQKTTIRFTVDLPESVHVALSALAQTQRTHKATLVKLAIAQLSIDDPIEVVPSEKQTVRFTVDMELEKHEQFSILAIRMRRRRTDLARWAILRLLADCSNRSLV